MRINHYAIFAKLSTDSVDWNKLRDTSNEVPYFIPYSKQEYIESVGNSDYREYFEPIIQYCKSHDIKKIVSVGSGKSALEYHIKVNSDLKVIVTDTTESINRIKEFDIFDDAVQVNLLENNNRVEIDSNTLVLLGRIDTEFDDKDFAKLFSILNTIGTNYICLIPAELLSLRIVISELKTLVKSILTNKKRVHCGYARSKSEFVKAWSGFYKEVIEHSSNKMFQLIKK